MLVTKLRQVGDTHDYSETIQTPTMSLSGTIWLNWFINSIVGLTEGNLKTSRHFGESGVNNIHRLLYNS